MRRAAGEAGRRRAGGVHRRCPHRAARLGRRAVGGRVCRAVFAVLADTGGAVAWCRRGLFRRVADELGDLQRIRARLRTVEADMVSVLGELGLFRLGDIPGLTAVGAAAILAETGDPCRYHGSSSLVKHAGAVPGPRTLPAPSPARRASPAAVGPGCGWPSGARSGRCSSATP